MVPREGRDDNFNRPGEDLSAYRVVYPGDLVLNKMKTWQGSLGISDHHGIVSPAYFVCEQVGDGDPRFLHHLLRSPPLIAEYAARSKGIRPSQWDLPWDEFREIQVRFPSGWQQRRIAAHLDTETARIDALIEKKRQMLSLIGERQRTTTAFLALRGARRAVTRVARSAFFDQVSVHWAETQLRHVECEVQTGPFGSQLHTDDYVDDGWPVVNPASLIGGRIVAAPGTAVTDEKRRELSRHMLSPGDVVFGRRGEMGRAALVTTRETGWLCGTGSLRLRLKGQKLMPEYLKLLLETPALRGYFTLASVGSTMDNLNADIVLGCPVLIPPREEQVDILARASSIQTWSDEVRARLKRQVDLLVEHRQALITAAVTGELDLAEAA